MAANHRGAAALLLIIASLLVVVALSGSGADARPTVLPDKTAAALGGADAMRTGGDTMVTVPRDANVTGNVAAASAKPDCEEGEGDDDHRHHKGHQGHKHGNGNGEYAEPPVQGKHGNVDGGYAAPPVQGRDGGYAEPPVEGQGSDTVTGTDSEKSALGQELCSDCEEPKKEPPPCSTCEPEMTCNEVHAVKDGETCDSIVQCKGLASQDDFLRFNPNLCCDKLFVGQWVCLDATCAGSG